MSHGCSVQDMDADVPVRHDRQAGSSSGPKPLAVGTASGGHSQAGSGKTHDNPAEVDKANTGDKEAASAWPNGNGLIVRVKSEDKSDAVRLSPAVERLKSRWAEVSEHRLSCLLCERRCQNCSASALAKIARKLQTVLVTTHIRAEATPFKLTSSLQADVCFSAQASRRSMCRNQGNKPQYN